MRSKNMDDISWTGNESDQYKELVYTLLDVTRIFSPSSMEEEMILYCDNMLRSCGFETSVDQLGNITAVRGHLPRYICLNAHMDTVIEAVPHKYYKNPGAQEYYDSIKTELVSLQTIQNRMYKEYHSMSKSQQKERYKGYLKEYNALTNKKDIIRDIIYAKTVAKFPPIYHIEKGYWRPNEIRYFPKSGHINSTKDNRDLYIGGDDKCGVAIILTLAKLTNYSFKVVLSVREEPPFHGKMHGISAVNPEFFSDVSASLTIDKAGSRYLVGNIDGKKLCDPKILQVIKKIGKTCGVDYEITNGVTCDAVTISKYTNAVNMSCGYYNPHHPRDYVVVPETYAIMCVIEKFISSLYTSI
jgi:hypothetical protein